MISATAMNWGATEHKTEKQELLTPKVNGWKPDDAVLVFQTVLAVCLEQKWAVQIEVVGGAREQTRRRDA